MTPHFLDRALLPLRLARARAGGAFVAERGLGTPLFSQGFDLGFPQGEAAYNAMGQARDGVVYFAIGTKSLDTGARLFAFDPTSSSVRLVADLSQELADPGVRSIPQGKVHVDLVPIGGALIGATHIGYYDARAESEQPGTAAGYAPYPGGWFFSIENDRVMPLAQAPAGEGIITMSADMQRGLLFALTWPRGLFLTFDLASRRIRNHGPVLCAGETGSKRDGTWVRICRSIGVDAAGNAFWSDGAGCIVRFDGSSMDTVSSTPRREMWRKVIWQAAQRMFYGVLWKSAALFRFDPASLVCEEIGTLRAGTAPATLAFARDSDGQIIHALATGPGVLRDRQIQLASTVSYVTHDLATGTMRASGPLRLGDARWITQAQSLLIAGGSAYSLCWVEVPAADRSSRARQIRRIRRHTGEYRTRGYAEEMMLVRFAPFTTA